MKKSRQEPPAARGIGFMLASAFLLAAAIAAADLAEPPPDLLKRIAAREDATEEARNNYVWRQTMMEQELDSRGAETGHYREVLDVLFSPEGKRIEQQVEKPFNSMRHLKLSPEDFSDLRDIQPMLLTSEHVFMYEWQFRGSEPVDGVGCFLIEVRPRQLLEGQRLFQGMLWVNPTDFSIMRSQ